MIQSIVNNFTNRKHELADKWSKDEPDSYFDIVKGVVELITDDEVPLDPERIHTIDDGDYQGTLLYVIAAKGYQPSTYWAVYVGYGSCSGCDTLQSIQYDETDAAKRVDQFMSLALHIVQGIKEI